MRRTSVAVYPETKDLTQVRAKGFIGISLNNSVSESPLLLRQVVDWATAQLHSFDILIGDSLERHNYEAFLHSPAGAASDQALEDGRRVADCVRHLEGVPDLASQILMASQLSRHFTYPDRLARFRSLYQSNPRFRAPIDETIAAFIARKHPSIEIDPLIMHHCVEYQLEELALFELLADDGYSIFVYPGSQLAIMKRLVSGVLTGASHSFHNLLLVELRLFT